MRNITALIIFMTLLAGCIDGPDRHGVQCRDIGELPGGHLLLFGEMHGSIEAPALIADVACHLSLSGDVTIGLEIPATEQAQIDDYLASAGTAVAFMGNIHAMQEKFVVEDFSMTPAGQLLEDLSPTSILITYPKGTVCACMPDCGVHDVAPRNPINGPSGFREGASMTGYSHTYLLGSITASPPASEGSKVELRQPPAGQ